MISLDQELPCNRSENQGHISITYILTQRRIGTVVETHPSMHGSLNELLMVKSDNWLVTLVLQFYSHLQCFKPQDPGQSPNLKKASMHERP